MKTGSESAALGENSTSKITRDAFYRAVFKDEKYCVDLFRLVLSEEEFDAFDWSTLSNDADTLFTSDWNERRPDLVESSNWKLSSRRLQLISVIEHKSRNDSDVLLQLHDYCAIIMRTQHRPVPPVVVYSGLRMLSQV